MKINIFVMFFVLGLISCAWATNVMDCHDNDIAIEDISSRVKVGNCKKPPCRLRKNTKVKVQIKIKPDRDVEKITNAIQAFISGIPFPFPGIDGTDACADIYSADGTKQVGCPLKKGEEYLYNRDMEVLQIYPRLKLVVHYGMMGSDGKYVTCFETPARITN